MENNSDILRLIDIKDLNKDDPYYLATDLQQNIILNLAEKSNIFLP